MAFLSSLGIWGKFFSRIRGRWLGKLEASETHFHSNGFSTPLFDLLIYAPYLRKKLLIQILRQVLWAYFILQTLLERINPICFVSNTKYVTQER